MKLKITDEKLNKFIQGYVDRGTKFTYKEIYEMVEIYYQFKVDKLMSIIEMQKHTMQFLVNDARSFGLESEIYVSKCALVLLETDKMLKELKGAE